MKTLLRIVAGLLLLVSLFAFFGGVSEADSYSSDANPMPFFLAAAGGGITSVMFFAFASVLAHLETMAGAAQDWQNLYSDIGQSENQEPRDYTTSITRYASPGRVDG